MRRHALVGLLLVLGSFGTVPAHADTITAYEHSGSMTGRGRLCGFATASDPFASPGTQTGSMEAGPLVVTDDNNLTVPRSGQLRCTIQVNAGTHAGSDSVAVTSAPDFGYAELFPTAISYQAAPGDDVYVCSAVILDGYDLRYYDDDTGVWTYSNTASCALAVSWTSPEQIVTDLVGYTVNQVNAILRAPCPTVVVTVCASYTAGSVYQTYTAYGPSGATTHVAGYVDAYTFTLPNGGEVTVPCVTLVDGSTTTSPCTAAGGTFAFRYLTLADRDVPQAGAPLTDPLATVRVCNANLVLTVDGFGVNSFPAYTIC